MLRDDWSTLRDDCRDLYEVASPVIGAAWELFFLVVRCWRIVLLEKAVEGVGGGSAGGSLCRMGPQLADPNPGRKRFDALLIGHRMNKRYGLLIWPMDISLERFILRIVRSLACCHT